MPDPTMPFFKPAEYQPAFHWSSYIEPLTNNQAGDLNLDVLFVGGGPAGLSGAIYLKQLANKLFPDLQIGVMDKGSRMGAHSLSGAVINPSAFKALFPDIKESNLPFRKKVQSEKLFLLTPTRRVRLPLPPSMKNKNFYTASLCEVVRWMSTQASQMGISILPSFTARKLLMKNHHVHGVATCPAGLNKDGSPSSGYQAECRVQAKLTVLADGARGHLSQAYLHKQNITSKYAQTYALGVKELWETAPNSPGQGFANQNTVVHTMNYPLPPDCFGGGWLYPLGEGLLSLGLVGGLDSGLQNLDVHQQLQRLKNHPYFARLLKGGKCVEWGAKIIPEGGYYAMPGRLSGGGVLLTGDSAGMVNVPALKGIHYAMHSGMLAGETAFSALKENNFSHAFLKSYDEKVRTSRMSQELYLVRNVRQAFSKNLWTGLLKSGLMFLSQGRFPGDLTPSSLTAAEQHSADAQILRNKKTAGLASASPQAVKALSKTEAVYLSGNKTRDNIPPHLKAQQPLPPHLQEFYTRMCPAGVYEQQNGQLKINAPNCIDCKATDVLGPRWSPKEGSAGPNYQKM